MLVYNYVCLSACQSDFLWFYIHMYSILSDDNEVFGWPLDRTKLSKNSSNLMDT